LAATLLAMSPVTTATAPEALTGTFGGDRVNATFTANGARLEFDCAVAEIDGAVLPGSDGRFVARGRYLADHPGPIAGDVARRAVAAVFEGWLAGDTLRLELKVTGEPATQVLTLVRGKRVKLVRCL
jgi:hypothetical protein